MKMSTTTILVLVVIAIVGAVVYSSYSGDKDAMMKDAGSSDAMMLEEKAADDTMMAGDEAMVGDDTAVGGDAMMEGEEAMMEKEADMTIDMKAFSFTPNVIELKAGESMTIKLTNSGGFHDLVIDELDVASKQIAEGDETMVTITAPADASGESYEFYCSVGDHRAKGMVGTITIL